MVYRNFAILFGGIVLVQVYRWLWPLWPDFSRVEVRSFLIVFVANTLMIAVLLAAQQLTQVPRSRPFKVFTALVCILFFLGWGVMTLGAEFMRAFTTTVTNPFYYGEIVKGMRSRTPELFAHFPVKIPDQAARVKFSYNPGPLQAAEHVQLRYKTTPEEIERLYETFSRARQKSFFGGDTNIHRNVEEGMPTTFFYTGYDRGGSFPVDYEIMTFDPVIKKADRKEGFYWNHGQSHGVAISRQREEIVYWAERW